jgi:hypothetical protein
MVEGTGISTGRCTANSGLSVVSCLHFRETGIFAYLEELPKDYVLVLDITIELSVSETLLRFEVFTAVTMKNAVFWDIKTQIVLHRRHITSLLQRPVG